MDDCSFLGGGVILMEIILELLQLVVIYEAITVQRSPLFYQILSTRIAVYYDTCIQLYVGHYHIRTFFEWFVWNDLLAHLCM